MQIKLKLALLFTLLAMAMLTLFAVFIYFSAAGDRRNEFYNTLQKEAMTRANVLLGAGVDAQTLQTIYMEHRAIIHEVEVAIYEPDFNLIYHDAVEIDFVKETPEMIAEIMDKGEIRFVQDGWEVVGILYYFGGEPYVLTAAAYDEYGLTKLANLLNILLISWLAAVVILFFAGRFFAWRALLPVSQMVDKAGDISATNLHLRLHEGNGKDELAELAITFNQMLDRLEKSFDAQKEFVSNISHELRTPLSAIIGETELALSQSRDTQAYKTVLEDVHIDARRLSRLSTGLLDLAKASYDPDQIRMKETRLDEVLMDARGEVLKTNPHFRINLVFDENVDEEDLVIVRGNAYMLKVAFANLMDNACKYSSDNAAGVILGFENQKPVVSVQDRGEGIPEEEIPLLFEPFFRGSNKHLAEGSGIGLLLVKRIAELHKARLELSSSQGKGTVVRITW